MVRDQMGITWALGPTTTFQYAGEQTVLDSQNTVLSTSSAHFDFSGDVEMELTFLSHYATTSVSLFQCDATIDYTGHYLYVDDNGHIAMQFQRSGDTYSTLTGTSVIATETWYTVRVVKVALEVELFVNGISEGTLTLPSAAVPPQRNRIAYIGQGVLYSRQFNGRISGFSYIASNGIVFDPYWDDVVALLRFNGDPDSTVFTDEIEHVWTPTGAAKISAVQSRYDGAAGYFNGSSKITTPVHADFGFSAGDWTIEAWVYPSVVTGNVCLLETRDTGVQGIGIYTSLSSSSNRWGCYNNSSLIAAGSNLVANTWTHLAIVRSGNTINGYVNGALDFTGTDNRTYASAAIVTAGANYIGSQYYTGYVDELRITKGIARYTGSFTLPSTRLPSGGGGN
jgi:hypothetical protein